MQRTLNNTVPPGGRNQAPQQGGQGQHSPAYIMASRIRNEQGKERASEDLMAMEPFLAPGEREHIARSLELPPPPERQRPQPANQPQQTYNQQPQYNQPQYNQQTASGFPPQTTPFQGMPFMQQNRGGGMNDPMQMMQMLSSLGGMGNKAGGGGMNPMGNSPMGGNPMMLAQLLSGLMGKK